MPSPAAAPLLALQGRYTVVLSIVLLAPAHASRCGKAASKQPGPLAWHLLVLHSTARQPASGPGHCLAAARASRYGKATSKRPGRAPVSPAACTQSGRGSPEPARAALTLLPALAVAGGVSSGQAGCSAHLCAVKELVVQQTHQAPAHVSAHAVACMRSSTPWRPVAGPEQLLFVATRSWHSCHARLSHAAMSREEESLDRPCHCNVAGQWSLNPGTAGQTLLQLACCTTWLQGVLLGC